MESLHIGATHTTPTIHFDIVTGNFTIEGKAIAADTDAFFDPVIQWLKQYIKTPCALTNVRFKLEYFNVSSSKRILSILYILNTLMQDGQQSVHVHWCYHEGEEHMFEVGQDFAGMVKIPFSFTEYSLATAV